MTIDDDFNENEDIRLDVDGVPVVMEKCFNNILSDIRIEIEPGQGLVVKHA